MKIYDVFFKNLNYDVHYYLTTFGIKTQLVHKETKKETNLIKR